MTYTEADQAPNGSGTNGSTGRDWIRLFVIVLLVWFAAVLVLATRPTTDAVPLITPAGVEPATQSVECHSFLSSTPRSDGPLPVLEEGYAYARAACESQHREGRALLLLDAVFVAGGLAVAAKLAAARRRSAA
jgi:hypothetical protein